ncbi:hypothetical protein L873DRAFT_1719315 [Choiromyces venosus 120613-1]|uniref:Uncharacterized protein n=1 Tax=Choiromyces venosus 120613-1 TaxID=1336337 RepID=A0A3N4IZC0_9PEZI|nr:hypothetical protein L873DRAFT_1719315 [Choiromyces venosus 120613-1]
MLKEYARNLFRKQLYIYGDITYYVETNDIGAFSALAGSILSEENAVFNTYLSKQ